MAKFGMRKVLHSTYDEAVSKTTDALKSEGFGVLTQIDVRATLKAKLDVDFRRYVILGACNPPLAHHALSNELDVGVLLPCNVVVYEGDDQRAVVVAVDPMRTMAGDHPQLKEVAGMVHEKLGRVLSRLE